MSEIRPVPFGKRMVGPGHPVLVIAEIGVNHEGDVDACARMIEAAAKAGADSIKLQTVKAAENYVPGTESYEVFSKAELTDDETAAMFALARELGVEPFTTCGDFAALDFVETLAPAAYKISSGLLTHLPLIERIARGGATMFLSTGMARREQVERAVATARAAGAEHLSVMQCTSLYPAPPETLNLRFIRTLERDFGLPAGYSDHSAGTAAAPLAVAAGACVIEKHFSLDPSRDGFDHRVSLDPQGFAQMVEGIRAAEAMLGSAEKTLSANEADNAGKFHRCLVARRGITAGQSITPADVAVMRVAVGVKKGLPPEALLDAPGKTAVRDIDQFTPIAQDDIQ